MDLCLLFGGPARPKAHHLITLLKSLMESARRIFRGSSICRHLFLPGAGFLRTALLQQVRGANYPDGEARIFYRKMLDTRQAGYETFGAQTWARRERAAASCGHFPLDGRQPDQDDHCRERLRYSAGSTMISLQHAIGERDRPKPAAWVPCACAGGSKERNQKRAEDSP